MTSKDELYSTMKAVRIQQLISVEDYLAGELDSPVKCEFSNGVIYARAEEQIVHNRIAGNIFGLLHAKLRKKPCRPHTSDMKIRIRYPNHVRFYYPDVSVVCESNPSEDTFQDQPLIVVEVASPSTRRIDEEEKKDAYLSISTLLLYVIVEQNAPVAITFRRQDQGFIREVFTGLEAVIPLSAIETELALAEIYEGVVFPAETTAELGE